ncbi:MAG: type II toxin-antitoxin system Phd/YefM family antitoxin [Bacteroidales bacterium]|nr:type II toxin-antitoxin system Phd/YefM family antitoxin [Bacteroidales bacterium]MCD8393238.1 type II toxin-antitoxin system Phd/YefM family antitoxin [Bacteroidales bacterium]
MIIISTREFRANQGKYLRMVKEGQDVVLKTRSEGSFKITPVSEDDSLMTEEQFYAMVNSAIEEANRGEVYEMREDESPEDFFNRVAEDEL